MNQILTFIHTQPVSFFILIDGFDKQTDPIVSSYGWFTFVHLSGHIFPIRPTRYLPLFVNFTLFAKFLPFSISGCSFDSGTCPVTVTVYPGLKQSCGYFNRILDARFVL